MRDGSVLKICGSGLALLALAGCGSGGGVFNRARPNEFAVTRNPPLVVPPDFALVPPRPGAPSAQQSDSSTQALQAMFGGPARVSAGEASLLQAAGTTPDTGIRSDAGDPNTNVVDKGSQTREIIAAPAGQGQDSSVSTAPQ